MGTEHLNSDELGAYRERRLAGAALLRASEHLAGCEICRAALGAFSVSPDSRFENEPATYEEISAWLDDELDPVTRKEVARKFRTSLAARAELADLARFRDEMKREDARVYDFATPIARPNFRAFSRLILPLAAALMVAAIVWSASKNSSPAIATDRLEIPAQIQALAGATETLAGPASRGPRPQVLAPVATAVLSDRPEFKWTPVPGATAYRVEIANESGEVVASENVEGARNEFALPRALAAGEVYQWQIEARRGDEVIARFPAPPEPEAKFAILSAAERAAFEQADLEARSAISRGLVKAKFGLLDAAAADFATAPNDARARKFLEQLNARRR